MHRIHAVGTFIAWSLTHAPAELLVRGLKHRDIEVRSISFLLECVAVPTLWCVCTGTPSLRYGRIQSLCMLACRHLPDITNYNTRAPVLAVTIPQPKTRIGLRQAAAVNRRKVTID